MSIELKSVFSEIALIGAIGLTSTGLHAETVPDPIASARTTIKAANNAAIDLIALSVVNAFNPTGKLVTESGATMDIGIRKESCEKAIKTQKDMVDVKTYAGAQQTLVDVGQLSRETAHKQLTTHSNYLKNIEGQMTNIAQTCAALGIAIESKP